MSKNTYLFVNDKRHPRHLRNPKLFKKLQAEGKTRVYLNNVFNTESEQNKFISDHQQFMLNNQFDYIMTQLFRVYIKKKSVFRLPAADSNVDSTIHGQDCINEFFDISEQYILKFHSLFNAIYQKPLSDFEYHKKLIQRKIRLELEENGDGLNININKFLKLTKGKNASNKQDDKSSDSSSQSDSGSNISFKYSSDESIESEDILRLEKSDEKKEYLQNSDLAKVSIQKKFTHGLKSMISRSATNNMFENKLDKQKRRELKAKLHIGLDQVRKQQQISLRNHINFIFLQYAFSVEELHQQFKEFHKMFHTSFQIQKPELVSLIEYMGQSSMLGKDVMENIVFPEMGLDKPDPLLQHLNEKEVIAEDFIFSNQTHDKIWNELRKSKLDINFTDLLPYYMVFFFTYLLAQLEKRKLGFVDLLNPQLKTSLYNCFIRTGLDPHKLEEENITFLQIESALIDFKSQFPSTFSFEQMNSTLEQCRQRMDVDKLSRKERKKEAYQVKTTAGFVPNQIFKMPQAEQKKFIDQMASKQDKKLKGYQQKNLIQSKDCQVPCSQCVMVYDLKDELISFSQWIAYQIGIQMMSTKIAQQANKKHFIETYKSNQICENHQTPQRNPEFEMCPDILSTSKYLFEEKLWFLAKIQYDVVQFSYMNFNAIVKQELLKDIRQLMTPIKFCKKEGQSHHFQIVQPFLNNISEFERCLVPLSDQTILPSQSQSKVFSKKNEGQVVFLMFNYVESLFKVFKKNICPWATFKQVEQAVFFYIINVIHKCESILSDQLELKLIKADIKEFKNLGIASKSDLAELFKFNKLGARIENRIIRIYGQDSEMHKQIKEQIEKSTSKRKQTFSAYNSMFSGLNIQFKSFSVQDVYDMLDRNDSAYANIEKRGQESSLLTAPNLSQMFKNKQSEMKQKEYANQMNNIQSKSTKNIDHSKSKAKAQIENDIKSKLKFNMETKIIENKIQNGIFSKIQSMKKNQEEPGFSSDQQKRITQIEYLIDNLFYNDLSSIPKKLIPLNQNQSFEKNQERMFKGFGKNLMSKKSNKFYFKLLQIFGFRDESLTSLIDKDEMKQKLFYDISGRSFGEDDIFECFQIAFSQTNLSNWKLKNLQTIHDFRKIVLQTELDIDWNSTLMEKVVHEHEIQDHNCNEKASVDKKVNKMREQIMLESSQDIFNFSFKIMNKEAQRKNFVYGTNLLIKNSVSESECPHIYDQFNEKIGQKERKKLLEHLKIITDEIIKKQDAMSKSYQKLKLEDSQNQVRAALFNFLERKNTIMKYEQLKILQETMENTKTLEQSTTNLGISKDQNQSSAKEKKEHIRQLRFKTICDIQKTSHLEVFLTSQYHCGLMDIVDKSKKQFSERELREQEEKKWIEQKIENLKFTCENEPLDPINASGVIKKPRRNIFANKKASLAQQQREMFKHSQSSYSSGEELVIEAKEDEKLLVDPFDKKMMAKKFQLKKVKKQLREEDNVSMCSHELEIKKAKKKAQSSIFPKPSRDVGPIINMKLSDDEIGENFQGSQKSHESSDSIDGDPHRYVQNDNYFSLARQINKGIIIKDKNNIRDDPQCAIGQQQFKLSQVKKFQERMKYHEYQANKYRPNLKSMIENSSRKHLGECFLEDIEYQQNMRQHVDNPSNLSSRKRKIQVDDSSTILKKANLKGKSNQKQFESQLLAIPNDETKHNLEFDDSLRNDISQAFFTTRGDNSNIMNKTAQSQRIQGKPLKHSKAMSSISNTRRKKQGTIENSRQFQDQNNEYYKTSNRWLDQNDEEYIVEAFKTGQESDDDSRDYDNSFTYKVKTIQKKANRQNAFIDGKDKNSTGRQTYYTDGTRTATNRQSQRPSSKSPKTDQGDQDESNCQIF